MQAHRGWQVHQDMDMLAFVARALAHPDCCQRPAFALRLLSNLF